MSPVQRPVLGAVVLAVLVAASSAHAAIGDNVLVSRADGLNGAKGNTANGSGSPSLSETGRYVAFLSNFPFDLIADSASPVSSDIYFRDVQAGTTQLVDRATGATGAKAVAGYFPAISGDGRKVVFTSPTPLDPAVSGTSNNHAYLRDIDAQTTEVVDRATGASGAVGNVSAYDPHVSGTGRYVCFSSAANNLDPAATNGQLQTFVRDRQTATTTVVSRATGAGAVGNGVSGSCSISTDGRYVAFTSQSSNLSPDDGDTTPDSYVRDTQTNTTILASRADGASAKANGAASVQALSADGRHVLMYAFAANFGPNGLYVRDLDAGTTTLASRGPGDGVADSGSISGWTISGNGRYVAWRTTAQNLLPDDTDLIADVYWRDVRDKVTKLVSRAAGDSGVKGNHNSEAPSLSGDGAFVAFGTSADNLIPEDHDVYADIIEREVAPPSAPVAPVIPVTPVADTPVLTTPTGPTTSAVTLPPVTVAPKPAGPLELICSGRQLTILDIVPSGKELRVAGIARTELAGRTVTVMRGRQQLGSGTVRSDGRFAVTATKPSGTGHVRIFAMIGKAESQPLSIERRFVILGRKVKGTKLQLSMRFDGPVRGGKVQLVRRVSCKETQKVQSVTVGRKGTFTLSVPLPAAEQGLVFYRVLAPLQHAASYTLPIAVSATG